MNSTPRPRRRIRAWHWRTLIAPSRRGRRRVRRAPEIPSMTRALARATRCSSPPDTHAAAAARRRAAPAAPGSRRSFSPSPGRGLQGTQRLADDLAYGEKRVHRQQRVLENHLVAVAKSGQRRLAKGAVAVEHLAAVGNNEPHDNPGQGRLAGARPSHQRIDLAVQDIEVHGRHAASDAAVPPRNDAAAPPRPDAPPRPAGGFPPEVAIGFADQTQAEASPSPLLHVGGDLLGIGMTGSSEDVRRVPGRHHPRRS
jgi:hypothetical protein